MRCDAVRHIPFILEVAKLLSCWTVESYLRATNNFFLLNCQRHYAQRPTKWKASVLIYFHFLWILNSCLEFLLIKYYIMVYLHPTLSRLLSFPNIKLNPYLYLILTLLYSHANKMQKWARKRFWAGHAGKMD